ncbi:MAG: sugar phosphate isomerase/epimerase [Cyclobacteriaceae bacterium]|nr:sugar phosphate isomerase/epimerase [Cyclobacteriaceae bacterium SS2]
MTPLSRRSMLQKTGAIAAAPMISLSSCQEQKPKHQFTFCLNTSTIRGQNLKITDEIKTAAEAGYDGVEIWMNKLNAHIQEGGTTKDIKNLATDLGIKIENCISFPQWIVDDEQKRSEAYDQARKEMDLLAEIGCPRVAAPPAGATNPPSLNLLEAAKRYQKLLEIGRETGVLPQLELWGFSHNLHLFGEVMYVASEAAHPDACILPDIYHIYKGGSDFEGLRMLDSSAIHMFHMNDYPASPSREDIKDSHRVFPGDGVAPIGKALGYLIDKNKPIVLSLELFNEDYYKMKALDAAKEGLDKMKMVVEKAIG